MFINSIELHTCISSQFVIWGTNFTIKIYITLVESQKGAINIQRCSIENQKGTIVVQSLRQ